MFGRRIAMKVKPLKKQQQLRRRQPTRVQPVRGTSAKYEKHTKWVKMKSQGVASSQTTSELKTSSNEGKDEADIDVISAKEMQRHLYSLETKARKSKRYDMAQCALVIVQVKPSGDVLHLTTEQIDTMSRLTDRELKLEARRKELLNKWKTLKIMREGVSHDMLRFDGSLPAGRPPDRYPGGAMKIELTSDDPTVSGQIPLSIDQLKELRTQMEKYLGKGFWRASSSPYSAPVLFTPKHNEDGMF